MGRFALYAGTAACVVTLCKAHAVVHEYSWSGSSRFAWSLGYIALLSIAAYGVGLPDQPRTRRRAMAAAASATAVAAIMVSAAQLFVGDALLPRFVVLGSAIILVPWYVLCANLARDGESRAGERDRVVVVAQAGEMESLEADLNRAPNDRPCSWVG